MLFSILWSFVFVCGGTFGYATATETGDKDTCPNGFLLPHRLFANETACPVVITDHVCHTCCPHDYMCCDNGTCMSYDPFCRYPSSCCREKYCGQKCCPPSHGVHCGPLCAPNTYTCCNTATGQLCAKPDVCCGDHCCPGNTHYCCDGHCCEKGFGCCNGICCEPGYKCCGDHCCPSGTECQAGPHCCPDNLFCGLHQCCRPGFHCVHNENTESCCDHQFCFGTNRCCHPGTHCNARGGCCRDNQIFCPLGDIDNCFDPPYTQCCSDGGACPADYPQCVGSEYCCPRGYTSVCGGRCYARNCNCCGANCCTSGYYCASSGTCKECHDKCWSWCSWSWCCHTECTYESEGNTAAPKRRPHFYDSLPRVQGRPTTTAQGETCAHPSSEQQMTDDTSVKAVKRARGSHQLPPAPHQVFSPNSFSCFHQKPELQDICKALACFEQISRCGPRGYLERARQLYCVGFTEFWDEFDRDGQKFINCTKARIVHSHLEVYDTGRIPCCDSMAHWGAGPNMKQTFLSCGFCHVFVANDDAFQQVFDEEGDHTDVFKLYAALCAKETNIVI